MSSRKDYMREYRRKNGQKQYGKPLSYEDNRAKTLKKYGLTLEAYAEMLEVQGGRCAICGAFPPPSKVLHVDHCHNSGKVRGLLCQKCNRGIGLLGDSVDNLRAALNYLE